MTPDPLWILFDFLSTWQSLAVVVQGCLPWSPLSAVFTARIPQSPVPFFHFPWEVHHGKGWQHTLRPLLSEPMTALKGGSELLPKELLLGRRPGSPLPAQSLRAFVLLGPGGQSLCQFKIPAYVIWHKENVQAWKSDCSLFPGKTLNRIYLHMCKMETPVISLHSIRFEQNCTL